MPLRKIVAANLRRTQAFDAELRSADEIDRIAAEFAEAILGEPKASKRKPEIDSLVSRLVKHAETNVLPQAEKIGTQNAVDILSRAPQPIDLNDPQERATALLRGRHRAAERLQIIRTGIDSNGNTLDAALTRYWLEPSEGNEKDKLERLRRIHNEMESRRKAWESAMQDFHSGKLTRRPSQPNLDFLSAMTAESKKDIREQARRAGTDAEISVFQAKGYAKFIWITPNGAAACPDCQNRQSVILTISEWERMGRPGSGKTICGAHCYCTLLPAEVAKVNPQLLSKGSVELGPSTDAAQMRVFNANRVATVAGVERKEGQASALATKIPPAPKTPPAPTAEETRAAAARAAADAAEKAKRDDIFQSALVTIHTPVSDQFRANVNKAFASIPENIRERMRTNGQEFHFSKMVTDGRPDLKGQTPRGWPPGTTWDENDCLAYGRTAAVAEYHMSNGKLVKSVRTERALRHEYGHTVDAIWDQTIGTYSKTPEFRAEWQKDFDAHTPAQRRELAYYRQSGDGGPAEAFAESFASLYGGGCQADFDAFQKAFPNTVAKVREFLK